MPRPARVRAASRPARVRVMSPQTRVALSRGRRHGGAAGERPSGGVFADPAGLGADELAALAGRLRAQGRQAARTLLLLAGVLFGLPALLAAVPELADGRLLGLPAGWLLVWVGVYPPLAALAWWQARTADRLERRR